MTVRDLVRKYFLICWNKSGLDTCENVAHKIIDKIEEDYPTREKVGYDEVLKETYDELHRLFGYPF